MSKTTRIVNAAIFCSWIFLISLLLYRNYAGTTIEKAAALKGSIDKVTHWYDVYDGAKKIGFAHTSFEKVGEEIIIRHERELKVRVGNAEKLLLESMKCLTDPSYTIKSLEYSSRMKDDKSIKVTGEVDSGEIIFFLESSGKRKTYKLSTKGKDFYLPTTFIPALVQKNPAPRSIFTIPVLDMMSLTLNDVKVIVEDVRPAKAGTQVIALYKIRAGDTVWWSNERGVIAKEESPTGITLYSQVEPLAQDPSNRVLFDYTALPFFKSNKLIQNTKPLKTLRVRIGRFPLSPDLYQKSMVTLNDNILTIRKEDPEEIKKRSYPLPMKNTSFSRYLAADEWIMSEHKTIKGNALNMARIEQNDAFRLARYLNSNLYFTIKTMPSFFLTNSMDILKSKFGDYLQRTVMLASFARAAGLPVRLVSGLVFVDGFFYFHTWPEIWFEKWIPVDPTLAQFPADVTHIPLKEGTVKEITSIVNEMRSLTIEVLEAS